MNASQQRINCSFNDKNSLYLAYMPFIKNGGLFVRSHQNTKPGTLVFLIVHLFTENKSYEIEAKVIWLTPIGAQRHKPTGIGLQFVGGDSQDFRNKVEALLTDMLESIHATDTM